MSLSEQTLSPITRQQIARYAGAVRDFNPMHVDEAFATAAGMPSVIAHGPLTATLITDAIVSQIGADRIRGLDLRLKAPVVPDEAPLHVVPTDDGVELRQGDGTVLAVATVEIDDD